MRHLSAIARLVATCALLVATPSLAACGDGAGGQPSASVPTATTPPSTIHALWPDLAEGTDASPRAVARSFVVDFIGMKDPALGEFQQGDSRSGEVPVLLRGEDGRVHEDRVIATIAVRQLSGPRWFVIAAFSDDVQIQNPEAGAWIASPLRVAGEAAGFEGNVVVSVHAAFTPKPLAQHAVIAGSEEPEPFSTELAFGRSGTATGAIVARTGGGLDGTTPFSAIPVVFHAE